MRTLQADFLLLMRISHTHQARKKIPLHCLQFRPVYAIWSCMPVLESTYSTGHELGSNFCGTATNPQTSVYSTACKVCGGLWLKFREGM